MKQDGARHDIIREWRSLPKEQRQTDEQAEAFAVKASLTFRKWLQLISVTPVIG
jgi:hypothetical protein